MIPFYKGVDKLELCLRSVFNANPQPLEVILVHDGAEEDLSALREKFPALRYGKLEQRSGPGRARYEGTLLARGEAVAFLDSDCIVDPGWFGIASLELTPDVACVFGSYRLYNKTNPVAVYEAFELWQLYLGHKDGHASKAAFIHGGCSVFWRWALEKINWKNIFLFAGFAAGEDTILGYEVQKKFAVKRVDALRVLHHFRESWIAYFRKRFIDGYSRTLISFFYPRQAFSKRALNFSYIGGHLTAGLFLAAVVIFYPSGSLWIILLGYLVLAYFLEKDFIRLILLPGSCALSGFQRGLLILLKPAVSLLRNIFWAAGIIFGGIGCARLKR